MILFWVLLALIALGVGAFIARPYLKQRAWAWAALAGAAAPIVAIAVYLDIGEPSLATLSGSPGLNEEQRELEAIVAELQAAADAAPDDEETWRRLASANLALPDYAGAAAAFEHMMVLAPDETALKSAWAEATVLSRGGVVTPEALDAFETAYAADPTDIRAQFYIAEAKYQSGRADEAIADWVALVESAEPGAGWLGTVGRRLERALQMQERSLDSIGMTPDAVANVEAALNGTAPRRGPSEADVAAAANMDPDAQAAFIENMVAGLAARLEANPDDLEGWQMLARSYQQLGRGEDWINALGEVLRLQPEDLKARRDHAYGLWLVRTNTGPPDEETKAALEDLLTRDPADPVALLGLAEAAKVDGDNARARELLTRLIEDSNAPEVLRSEAAAVLETVPTGEELPSPP